MTSALDAIAGAYHADPFSVLGPHIERGRLVIRACLPAAEAVSVVRDGLAPVAMTRSHPVGVYEATFPETPHAGVDIDYRLKFTDAGGSVAAITRALRQPV